MKTISKTKLIIFCILLSVACSKKEAEPTISAPFKIKVGTYLSEPFQLNGAKIQSFIKFSAEDTPSSVGIILPKNSIDHNFRYRIEDVLLPEEAQIKTLFKFIDLFKENEIKLIEKCSDKNFVIRFSLKSRKDYGIMATDYQKNGYNSPSFKDPDAGIIPSGFKKYFLPSTIEYTDPILHFVNENCSLFITSYNNEIYEFRILINLKELLTNPNVSFNIPLTTQKGYFPTKISVLQTGNDIVVTLDELKNVN